jgi:hypothetical protein
LAVGSRGRVAQPERLTGRLFAATRRGKGGAECCLFSPGLDGPVGCLTRLEGSQTLRVLVVFCQTTPSRQALGPWQHKHKPLPGSCWKGVQRPKDRHVRGRDAVVGCFALGLSTCSKTDAWAMKKTTLATKRWLENRREGETAGALALSNWVAPGYK